MYQNISKILLNMKILLFTLMLICLIRANAQDYTVDFEDRNKTIYLTNDAVKLINNGEFNAAIDSLFKAISIDSTFRATYQTLYKASVLGKNYSITIIDNLKKGTRIFNDDDELSFYLGELYKFNNEYEIAIQQYTLSINFSKVNGEDFDLVYLYYFNRGNCYLVSEQFQKAIEDYNYSLKLKPNNGNVYTNRGTCYMKVNENSKACDDWRKAYELSVSVASQYLKKYCKVM